MPVPAPQVLDPTYVDSIECGMDIQHNDFFDFAPTTTPTHTNPTTSTSPHHTHTGICGASGGGGGGSGYINYIEYYNIILY